MSLSYLVQSALDEVNKIRADEDLPPLFDLPKGERGRGSHCPIGKAVKGFASGDGRVMIRSGKLYPANPPISAFISALDDGLLPQYEVE